MTDATEAIASLRWARTYNTECHIRPRQIVELLAHIDAQAAEIQRLTAVVKKANDQAEHFEREWYLRCDEIERLRDVLLRNGFAHCDIPACNCGSWHARYGLPERLQEIKDVLADAGHPLSNENGNLAINALRGLVADRDELRVDAERYRWLRDNPWPEWLRLTIVQHRNGLFDAEIDKAMKEKK